MCQNLPFPESENIFAIEQIATVLCFLKMLHFYWDARYVLDFTDFYSLPGPQLKVLNFEACG